MESKWIEVQMSKVLSFKLQVGKVKTGQTTGGFTVISPYTHTHTHTHTYKFLNKTQLFIISVGKSNFASHMKHTMEATITDLLHSWKITCNLEL